jgi:hypothetical protein
MEEPTLDDIKQMRELARGIAFKNRRLTCDDVDELSLDLAQEGWIAWLGAAEKPRWVRFKAASDRMSDYWRRWRWGIHYRASIESDGTRIGKRTRSVRRPSINHVDIDDLTDSLVYNAHVEETVSAGEIWNLILNSFKTQFRPDRLERTLFECVMGEGKRFPGNKGEMSGSTKVRCLKSIREAVSSVVEGMRV